VYDKTVNTQGRARSLRCPHFVEDGGRCGIHAHRNHLCATWFCRPVRGVRGRQLWQSAEKLLAAVERDLSMAAALHLGIAPSALAALLPALLTPAADIDADAVDGVVSEAVWAARWGSWADCIEDYFEAAAAFVDPMSWTDVLSACGPDVHIRARVVQDLAAGLDAPIPVRLRAGILHTLGHGEGTVAITTTDPLDPMVLPTALLGALVRFDGRPVHQVVAQLRNEGIELDDATLRALVDHAVLVE
jgi:lambda repressor-like predicted transcriptional regulator